MVSLHDFIGHKYDPKPPPKYVMMSHRKFSENATPKINGIEEVTMIGLDKKTGIPCDPTIPNAEPYYCICASAPGNVNILMNSSNSYLILERENSSIYGFYLPTRDSRDEKREFRVLSEERAKIHCKWWELSIKDQHALNIAKRQFRKRVFPSNIV